MSRPSPSRLAQISLLEDNVKMIDSREKYLLYLDADRIALGTKGDIKAILFDDIWRFQRLLRKYEYLINCRGNKIRRLIAQYLFRRSSRKLGYTIPINVFGPGLSIAHVGPIVINNQVRVGENCRIHVCVNIGASAESSSEVPQIGNNCYIGPGAKIFGGIVIGDNVRVGANAVVNMSFHDGNCTIAGVPARKISDKTSLSVFEKRKMLIQTIR